MPNNSEFSRVTNGTDKEKTIIQSSDDSGYADKFEDRKVYYNIFVFLFVIFNKDKVYLIHIFLRILQKWTKTFWRKYQISKRKLTI